MGGRACGMRSRGGSGGASRTWRTRRSARYMRYPLERAGVFHLLQQHEVEVARHAERMLDAGLPKSPEEKLPDGHCQALAPGTDRGTLSHHCHLDPPRPGTSVLTGAPAVLVVALTPC